MTAKDALSRMLNMSRRAQAALTSPRAQRVVWGIAVVVFFGGLALSLASQPSLLAGLRLEALMILGFALCPFMTAVNMALTKELARLAGVALSFSAALKLAVMSTAANHLPAPGGPLLRMAAFQSAGASLKDAGLANIALGLIWIGATFLFAGPWASLMDWRIGAAFAGVAAAFLVIAFAISARLPGGVAGAVRLLAVSLVSAAAYAFSVYVALHAFAAMWTFPQAAVVAAAGVIGSAASITPSGLGVREAAAAGLAALIGADPAAAFAATAAVHIAMTAVMGACALLFAGRREKPVAP